MIHSVFQKQLIFELSGVHDANATEQLLNFSKAIADALGSQLTPAAPKNWTEAFWQLREFATPIIKKRKAVIFFDEFPWLSSHKSGFLSAFEYFWNQWASQ
ncbi:hypothetical protein [Pedobacter sp. KBW01]|uniref:hypothetical protein n=1 Tax=Pedobacter sp. KBW01 TaxID=2153364 RepID=UPI0018F76D20|nr:hypothetical protein [Pedobacter sp. KBW01]